MEDITGILTGEVPVYEGPFAVDLTVPCSGFRFQHGKSGKASLAEALAGKKSYYQFSWIEPASVFRRVVDREAIPQRDTFFQAEVRGERFLAVNVEVIHNPMDRACPWIAARDLGDQLGKLRSATVGRREGEVPPSPRLHGAKHIRSALPLVLAVALGHDSSGTSRFRRSHLIVQADGFLIQTYHRFLRIMGAFVQFQYVFHALQIGAVDLWQAPHFFPATV